MPACEDLATKEELRELKEELQTLREQLNEVFGEDENGVVQQIFEVGSTANDAKDTAELAIWGLTKLRASEALVDIKQAVVNFLPDSLNLARGNSQWVKVKGSGLTDSMINLDKVSTLSGKNSLASKVTSKISSKALEGISLLSDLVQLQGTLAINMATVDILDKRIEAESKGLSLQIDVVNDGLLKLYSKNSGDITIIQEYLNSVNENLETNRANTVSNTEELDSLKEKNVEIETDLERVWAAIEDLRRKNAEVRSEVDEFRNELDEVADELTQSVDELDIKLDNTNQVLENLRIEIEKSNEAIDLIKEKLIELEERVTQLETDVVTLKEELEILEDDLREEINLVDARSKSNEADIILLFKKISKQSFEAIEITEELPEDPEGENVENADIEELKQYINDKVTALLDAQFTDKIEPAVKVIEREIKNEDYGLEKIQEDANTAWESTQNDKAMNATNLAFSIHNALMLSNNLPATITEASRIDFKVLQLTDRAGESYDANAAINNKTQALLPIFTSLEERAALTSRIAKVNRVYQTGINLLDTTYGFFDSARTLAEMTAENTGKIGNALRESCTVYEDAYEEFVETIEPQNTSFKKLGKLREEVTSIVDVFNSIEQISSDVVEFEEVANKLRTEKSTLANQIDEAIQAEIEIREERLRQSITTANITRDAFASSSEVT